ncbi:MULTISPECIES: hypothetical protein [Streptomyces]|uniref:hypothetical protein n=1 Tax=Streptomyces TaxID=1883 RepID=UPI00115FBB32|nr:MULTISPECIES: hypothetical protein [unclassified Streptomyces]
MSQESPSFRRGRSQFVERFEESGADFAVEVGLALEGSDVAPKAFHADPVPAGARQASGHGERGGRVVPYLRVREGFGTGFPDDRHT